MAQALVSALLLTLILSLGFGQLLRFDYLGVPLYLHDALVLLLIPLLLLHNRPRLRQLLPRSSWIFLAGLTVGWVRALTLYSPHLLLRPSLYTLRLLAYLALYQGLKLARVTVPRPLLLLSGLVTLSLGLSQYLLLPDMRLFAYLGWDDHLNRLVLPHYDPTYTGAMLSMFLLLVSPRSLPLIASSLVAILLTYSRSIWLSLVATVILLAKNRGLTLITLCCLLVTSIWLLPKRFGEGNNLLRTYSLTSRLSTDMAYLRRYDLDLLVGRGYNTLPLDETPKAIPNHQTGPNNSYLLLLATSGVLGLVGWLNFLRSLARDRSSRAPLLFVCLASLANNVMFYSFTLLLLLLASLTAPIQGASSAPSHSLQGLWLRLQSPARPRLAGRPH